MWRSRKRRRPPRPPKHRSPSYSFIHSAQELERPKRVEREIGGSTPEIRKKTDGAPPDLSNPKSYSNPFGRLVDLVVETLVAWSVGFNSGMWGDGFQSGLMSYLKSALRGRESGNAGRRLAYDERTRGDRVGPAVGRMTGGQA